MCVQPLQWKTHHIFYVCFTNGIDRKNISYSIMCRIIWRNNIFGFFPRLVVVVRFRFVCLSHYNRHYFSCARQFPIRFPVIFFSIPHRRSQPLVSLYQLPTASFLSIRNHIEIRKIFETFLLFLYSHSRAHRNDVRFPFIRFQVNWYKRFFFYYL